MNTGRIVYQIYGIESGKKHNSAFDRKFAQIVKQRAEIMYDEKCVIIERVNE